MMKLAPIIVSLLDTDLYKFNMNMVMFHKHTNLNGKYFDCLKNEKLENQITVQAYSYGIFVKTEN